MIPQERKHVIEACDAAFTSPIALRERYGELVKKWDAAADFLVAYNGQYLGYVIFYANNIDTATAYISIIVVHPLYQNKRVGYRLLTAAEVLARERGMKRIELEVQSQNEKAMAFYQKNGFYKKADKTDRFLLEKKL